MVNEQIQLIKNNGMKYVDNTGLDTIDPSKMTITQKLQMQKLKGLNKKVSYTLKKDYEVKLRFTMGKHRQLTE